MIDLKKMKRGETKTKNNTIIVYVTFVKEKAADSTIRSGPLGLHDPYIKDA